MNVRLRGVKKGPITERYFQWMSNLVCDGKYTRGLSWEALFRELHQTIFTYILPMDENRATDGTDLRYRFGYEEGYSRDELLCLDDRECSVLEMMVALALRCEEHIMDDPESGDRTGRWFFEMIENLGLADMDDEHFERETVHFVIRRFLDRDYEPNGEGGLFSLGSGDHRDMRRIDIWYQMMWYLNSILYGRR